MEEEEAAILGGLADSDLLGLRLAAQIMAHKAGLEDRVHVASYFGRLEQFIQAELASRLTGIRAAVGQPGLGLDEEPATGDARLIGEYLGLLIANEQLTPQLRDACRRLRTLAGADRSDA